MQISYKIKSHYTLQINFFTDILKEIEVTIMTILIIKSRRDK